MRVVSLLPSLSELVCALGARDELVGVTHECDCPASVTTLPSLTMSRIPEDATSAEIDALVSEVGGSLYELDTGLLAELQPDLILTQTQCEVCAVSEAAVREVAGVLPGRPHVESVDPRTLADVFAMFRRIGDLLGRRSEADSLVARFEATAAEIRRRRAGRPEPSVVHLEWFDPPFSPGHWIPDLIAIAGGRTLLGRSGERSTAMEWSTVVRAAPEVLILAPCGFTLERTEAERDAWESRREWRSLPAVRNGHVVIADGSAYFSRPGPRLEAGLRITAAAIDPETCAEIAPPRGWKRLEALE